MKRDSSIEMYRSLLMLGICWLHCCQQGGRFSETMNIYYLMRPAVVGFVFISGWFGIRYSTVKVFKLIGISAVCSMISVCICYRVGVIYDFVYSFTKGYWFLWAYVALLIVSPILNAAIEGEKRIVNKRIIPLLAVVFIWSFMTHVPILKNYMPKTAGVSDLSFLMMSGVYIVARLIRERQYDRYLRGNLFWGAFIVSIVLCCLGFSHYDSIFSLIVAVGMFQIVRNIRMPIWLGRIVLLILPSVFPIYILHQTYKGFNFVKMGMDIGRILHGSHPFIQTFVAAVVVFWSCAAVDMARRSVVGIVFKISRCKSNEINE